MEFTTRPELAGSFGMVASTHWLASSVGMSVLERGGNAFDAAVAAGLTLQVVEPHQNGPGGDLPVIFCPRGGAPTVLCAQGPAPAGASRAVFGDLGLEMIPGTGPLAAVIPGATLGWLTLLRDYGTWAVHDVLAYAIHYASSGYPVTMKISEYIGNVARLFTEHWSSSARLYLPGGNVPQPGSVLRNPTLARTYQRLVDAAAGTPDRETGIDRAMMAWSQGFVASAVDEFVTTPWMDSTGTAHHGLLTAEDMAQWRPSYEQPRTYPFGDYRVCKPGPWSQGPVLLQQLALLEPFGVEPDSPDHLHRVIEAAKLAFADRDAWYGDTAAVPLRELFSPAYNQQRRELITDEASMELRPGEPLGQAARLPSFVAQHVAAGFDAAVGEPNSAATATDGAPLVDGAARSDTVHVDVVDHWGNMISAMPSGGWLHSSPVIESLGFPLGTRLQMAWLDEGLPNTLAPGKRPRTTLSPTLVMAGDEPVLAFGTPGGDQQDQLQLGFLLNHLGAGMNMQEAIDHPALYTTHFPNSFYPHESEPGVVLVEERFDARTLTELERNGHQLVRAGHWNIGRLSAVRRDPATGTLHAAANPRWMQGYAVGR